MDNEERTERDGEAANKGQVGADTKYREHYAEEARKLCLLGADDEFLADFFNVCKATINNWKNEHPEFLDSIRAGKAVADMEIANSLYESAKGFELEEEQAIKVKTGQHTEGVEVVTLKKRFPPDYRSISLWLRNRQPEVWRDKIEVENTGNVTVFKPAFGEKNLDDNTEESEQN